MADWPVVRRNRFVAIVFRRSSQGLYGLATLLATGVVSGTFFAPLTGRVILVTLAVAAFLGILGMVVEAFATLEDRDNDD